MALTTVRRILTDQPVVVLGSAPLSEAARQVLSASVSHKLICVNGGISSVARKPDVFVLNSRQYDDRLYQDPKLWSESRKQLHELMLSQSANRQVRHLLFLLKSHKSDQTITKLREQHTKWRGQTELNTGHKTDLVRKAGVKRFQIAFNVSAGLFGACLALVSKAEKVLLVGFSFQDGHEYLPSATNHRFHISQDKEALDDLFAKHGDRLQFIP